jgi:hypothetical protein
METVIFSGLIGAVVGAAVTIAGWFVTERLRRRTALQQWEREQEDAERTRKREQEQAAKDVVQRVLATCYRRAIFTPTFYVHQNHAAMFASLSEARAELQQIAAQINSDKHQRLVAEIISQIDFIERCAQRYVGDASLDDYKNIAEDTSGSGSPPDESLNFIQDEEDTFEVDLAKSEIIRILKQLSSDVGVPYNLPRTIMTFRYEGMYRGLAEANEPPKQR